jgi:hypothetical protein
MAEKFDWEIGSTDLCTSLPATADHLEYVEVGRQALE